MSLLTDQDYFLQSLRLAFLRLDAPISLHSASRHVQSAPAFALSQHALYAGLTVEQVPEFGLARSPGPVPSTALSAAAGRRSPYSRDRSLGKNGSRNSRHTEALPLPLALGGAGAAGTGLKHSETIVGRHGEKGSGSGAAAGIRVKGRKTTWKPKPHHFGHLASVSGDTVDTPRGGNDLKPTDGDLQTENPFISDASDRTPQPSRRASLADGATQQDSDSDGYDEDQEDESTDEEADNASSDTEDGFGQNAGLPPAILAPAERRLFGSRSIMASGSGADRRPYSDRALSEAIVQTSMVGSPTDSYGASATTSASASQQDASLGGDDASASLSGSSAAQHMSRLTVGQNGRLRAGTLESSDAMSMQASSSVDDRLAGVDSDEEEDDFEFSLAGGEDSSSMEARLAPSFSSQGHIPGPQGGVNTYVSPSNNGAVLPSIAEAAEMNEQISGNGLDLGAVSASNAEAAEAGQRSEDIALKAIQAARRQARRRVNISGRMPLKLDIPPSPELQSGQAFSPVSPKLASVAPSTNNSASQPHSPNIATSRPGSRPTSPPGTGAFPFRPMPGRFARQRAQTDPVSLFTGNTPLPSPALPRTRSSDSQHPLRTVTPPIAVSRPQTPVKPRAHSLSSSPVPGQHNTAFNGTLPSLSITNGTGLPPHRSRSSGPGEISSPLRALDDGEAAVGMHTSDRSVRSADPSSTSFSARPSPHKNPSKSHDPYITFPIKKVTVSASAQPPSQSALSLMLRQKDSSGSSASKNPFNEFYGALFAPAKPATVGRRFGPARGNDSGAFEVTLYFPFSKEPNKPLKVTLKPDLIVEEVIGCALWKYWEAERKPSLLPDSSGNNDEEWDAKEEQVKAKLTTSQYVLRIADEDEDGEVDDDFPAPERTRPAKGFGNCFAVVPAAPAQARQNQNSDAQIQRRPSRIIRRLPKPALSPQPSAGSLAHAQQNTAASLMPPTATSHIIPTGGGGMGAAASYISTSFAATPTKSPFNPSGSANLVLVRIRIPLRGLEDITTAVKVPLDMYLADVLETLCKKRNLGSARDWVLVVPDRGIVVPLDRTVESLQGAYNLALQRKSSVSSMLGTTTTGAKTGMVNTNPSASIFKRLSEPPQPKYVTSADLNTNYRTYVVHRKMPMPLGRHERVFSLDNDYIHIMPSDAKLASGTVRTASYHISQVAACKTSKRAPSSFKLVVWRNKDRDVKRYDFEAANGGMAAEIVQTVQALMRAYKENVELEQAQG